MDEDLDDFEPDKSGGELGGLIALVISTPATLQGKPREGEYGGDAARIVSIMSSC